MTDADRTAQETALKQKYLGRLVRIRHDNEQEAICTGIVVETRVNLLRWSGQVRSELYIEGRVQRDAGSASHRTTDWWYIDHDGYWAEVHPGVSHDS